MKHKKYGILGAGSIGCFIGANLAKAGFTTVLLGRKSIQEEVSSNGGITVSDWSGKEWKADLSNLKAETESARLKDSDVIFFTVKSQDTEAACEDLKKSISTKTVLVSFQNGVRNADIIKKYFPNNTVIAGMVPYNVLRLENAKFHLGTSGILYLDGNFSESADIQTDLISSGLETNTHTDMTGVLWGKLVFNLNNPVNALAGIPLKEELSDPDYRKILSSVMKEAIFIMKSAGIQPRRLGKMIPTLAPYVLSLPNFLFFRVASAMVKIDPKARSSMWEDLNRGRKTEIDYLNGEIEKLASSAGKKAPLSENIIRLIRNAELSQAEKKNYSAKELLTEIKKDI